MRSVDELKALKEQVQGQIALREEGSATITVHMGTCGIANGAREILKAILEELQARNLTDVHVTQTGCPGLCHMEPLITVTIPGETPFMYGKLTPDNAKKIVAQHIVNKQPVQEWLVNLEK